MSFERVEIGPCTLYRGDCREVLPTLEGVDAVVTDPPYGIGFAAQPTKWQRRAGKAAKPWDDSTTANLAEVLQVAKTRVVWGGNYYPLPASRGWLVWHKPDAPPSMSAVELCWTNIDQNSRLISHSISATNKERVGHPTQKPLAVMEFTLFETGDCETVFDPFMGSGTTGVACVRLGRRFVGCEIDPEYFALACRRIAEADRIKRSELPLVKAPAAPRQPDLFSQST